MKGRAGDGDGDGDGEGRGEGEGSGNRSILDCNNMMTVLCVSCAKRRCFVKQNYRPSVGCDCSPRLVAKQTCWNIALSFGIFGGSVTVPF